MTTLRVGQLRELVANLYAQAYPKASKADAERWRMLTVGKPRTETWTRDDWIRAARVLEPRVRAKTRQNKDDGSSHVLDLGIVASKRS